MMWRVGLSVGNTHSVAVLAPPDADPIAIERESILHHGPDGSVRLGRDPQGSPGMSGFLDRVAADGPNAPQHHTRGEELVATAMFCLLREVEQSTDQPLTIYAAVPEKWSDGSVDVLRSALDRMNLTDITLVPEHEATWLTLVDTVHTSPAVARTNSHSASPTRGPRRRSTFVAKRASVRRRATPSDTTASNNGIHRPAVTAAASVMLLALAACATVFIVGRSDSTPTTELSDARSSENSDIANHTDPATIVPVSTPEAAPPPEEAPAPGTAAAAHTDPAPRSATSGGGGSTTVAPAHPNTGASESVDTGRTAYTVDAPVPTWSPPAAGDRHTYTPPAAGVPNLPSGNDNSYTPPAAGVPYSYSPPAAGVPYSYTPPAAGVPYSYSPPAAGVPNFN
ncbi:hypothetical protein ABH922_003698 [Rhodococcus sp. 27YEA15]|uniref:hypothetical protein n=1 Tax=Rhodococcus sp. 27YEA15 TaxID=3156259 RepID=UPI003C7C7945